MITGQIDNLQTINNYIKAQRALYKKQRQDANAKYKAKGYKAYYEYTNELSRIGGSIKVIKELSKFVQWQLKGAEYTEWVKDYITPVTDNQYNDIVLETDTLLNY